MSTIAIFPDETHSGPYINRLMSAPIEYQRDIFENEDGGADINVQPCGLRRWTLDYEGLSAADMTTLRTHYDAAKGKVNNFSFYHRQDAVTYTNVMYESFQVGKHPKTWSTPLTIVLVKFT